MTIGPTSSLCKDPKNWGLCPSRCEGTQRQKPPVSRVIGMFLLLWFATIMISCTGQPEVNEQEDQPLPKKSLEEVLQEHTGGLMAIPGVAGTAQGLCDGTPCIRVLVVERTDELLSLIPSTIEGYPVEVQATGEFRKLGPG